VLGGGAAAVWTRVSDDVDGAVSAFFRAAMNHSPRGRLGRLPLRWASMLIHIGGREGGGRGWFRTQARPISLLHPTPRLRARRACCPPEPLHSSPSRSHDASTRNSILDATLAARWSPQASLMTLSTSSDCADREHRAREGTAGCFKGRTGRHRRVLLCCAVPPHYDLATRRRTGQQIQCKAITCPMYKLLACTCQLH